MKRELWLAAAVAALGAATPAWGQPAKPFVPEFNTEGYPPLPADKLVSTTAAGYLQPFRGRPWWQVLAFCAGTWENQAYEAEQAKDQARADALREESNTRFFRPALRRLMADRGIDPEDAAEIMRPDINIQFLIAAETERPFADDQPRCKDIEMTHAAATRVAPRPAPPPASAPAVAQPAAPFERRFRAKADLTHRYDGETYWSLMMRCAIGSQGVPGPRGEMMGQFGRAAMALKVQDGKKTADEAKAELEAAAPALAPIAPGTSEADDACIAIGRQLEAEVAAQK